MRLTPSLSTIACLAIGLCAFVPAVSVAQTLYSVGGASLLQSIDTDNQQVEDLVTIVPLMSDIAFHPNGNLYGVSENSIYLIDEGDGTTQEIKQLPAAYGWLLGLTIDYTGKFYMSGLGGDEDFLITYDPATDETKNLGSIGWRHWDLEFYNGKLYASGGTTNVNEGLLIEIDIENPDRSKLILDYQAQGYGIASFSDDCGGTRLIVPTLNELHYLNPDQNTFTTVSIADPIYSGSLGASSKTSYLGSLPPLKVDSVEISEIPCSGDQTASVKVVPYPGRTGIEYSIDGENYQSSPLFDGLEQGEYTVYLRDDLGCIDTWGPLRIVASGFDYVVQTSAAHCNKPNGGISITTSQPEDSLLYSLDGIQFELTTQFTGLPAGNYTLHVRNRDSCIEMREVIISQIPMLTHDLNATAEHCNQEDGTILVSADNGQPPYSYSVVALPGQPDPLFTGLHAGNYLVRTSDDLGCEIEDLVLVDSTEGPVIGEISTSNAHCDMADGGATIFASSDSGNLLYSLDGTNFSDQAMFGNLGAGSYNLIVIDEAGCSAMENFIISTIDGPVIDSVIVTDSKCGQDNGSITVAASGITGDLVFSLDNGVSQLSGEFNALPPGGYTITIEDPFGCSVSIAVEVGASAPTSIQSVLATDATCGEDNGILEILPASAPGLLYSIDGNIYQQQNLFTGLASGVYTVTLQNASGCEDMSTIVIGELEFTEISALVSSAESCEGGDGTITVIPESITDGTQYSLDGFNFQTDSVFHGLSSGQYTVQSIDINGCIDEATVDVSRTAPFTITSLVAVSAQCDQPDGSVTIESDRPVNVMVNNIFSGTAPGTIGSLAAGTYVIEFSDANNCKLDTTIEITKENCGIFVPNVFSPNGDGSNDEFGPVVDINRYNIKAFNVYNRWGMAVFDCYGDCEWDGTNDGKASPAGVYVYYLLIEDKTGELLHYSGDITLVR